MLFGWTSFSSISFAGVPDPTLARQGAIVASVSTKPRYSADSTTTPKENAAVITSPGR
ncbi:MAG: hypothetical protein HQ485_02895 [Acidobacteria bacterium]|jgi:hypothetical protein|nr:hypothetical protein [Acidobacteriota bacterium]